MATQEFGVRLVVQGVAEFRRNIQASQSDLNNFGSAIRGVSGASSTLGQTLSRVGGAITGIGRSVTIGLTAPLAVLSGSLIKAGMEFEDAFAGIGKTVDGVALGFSEIKTMAENELGVTITTMDEAKRVAQEMGVAFGDLTPLGMLVRDQFREMALEIPIASSSLAELGEVIGQLGVDADAIAEVTKLISYLGVATDISAEEAAFGLIRFKNIMMGTTGDIEDFVRRAGSALVELGNASVSTEGEILSLTLRLAAAGDRAKMTAPEVLAWATTLTDLGVRAEAGGTAVSRAITEMVFAIQTGSDNLETFAAVSGKSVEAFKQAFEEDASSALGVFIQKLEEGIRTGTVTKDMLADMGLSGTRAIDIMGRLGDAMGIFGENLEVANNGWEEAVALQEEAEKRFVTMKSQLQLVKNAFTDLGITVFDLVKKDLSKFISALTETLKMFKRLDPVIQGNIIKFAGIAMAIGPVLVIVGTLISLLGALITTVVGLLSPIGLATVAVGLLGGALLAHFAPDIPGLIQPIIDKAKELAAIILGTPQMQPVVSTDEAGGFSPMDGREGGMAGLPVPTQEQLSMTERFVQVWENLKSSLNLPPAVLSSWQDFQNFLIDSRIEIDAAIRGIVTTVTEVLGPTFTDVIASLEETMAEFGIDWADVWEAVKFAVTFVIIAIGAIILGLIAVIIGVINAVGAGLDTFISFWSKAGDAVMMAIEGIIRTVMGMKMWIEGLISLWSGLFTIISGIVTADGDKIQAGLSSMGEGIKMVFEGVKQTVLGVFQTMWGLIATVVNAIIGIVGTLLNVIFGLLAGITATIGNFWAQSTGETENGILKISEFFTKLKDDVIGTVEALVVGVTEFFQSLFNILVGNSIVPDMVLAIVASFTELKDTVMSVAGALKDGVIGFFTDLAATAGELLAGIFGGGGKEGGFTLDTKAFDAAKAKIEEIKLSIENLQTTLNLAAQGFVTGFATVIIASATLMVVQFTTLWTTMALAVVAQTLMMFTAISLQMLNFSLLFTTNLFTLQLGWSNFMMFIVMSTTETLPVVTSLFTAMQTQVVTVLTELLGFFATVVAGFTAGFSRINSDAMYTALTMDQVAAIIVKAIAYATSIVMGLVGAFQMLASAAKSSIAAIIGALGALAAAAQAAQGAITASPTLAIQHPFELLEKYMKKADFSFSLDNRAMDLLTGPMNNLVVPASMRGGDTNNNQQMINNISGVMMTSESSLADLLLERFQMMEGTP